MEPAEVVAALAAWSVRLVQFNGHVAGQLGDGGLSGTRLTTVAGLTGVVAVAGDDHVAKSSSVAHQSDHIFKACGLPVFFPSSVQDILDMERLKTATYSFEAPLRAGALLAGAAAEDAERLARAGALLGVGYIVGLNIGIVVLSGSILSWHIAIPLYQAFFAGSDAALAAKIAAASSAVTSRLERAARSASAPRPTPPATTC